LYISRYLYWTRTHSSTRIEKVTARTTPDTAAASAQLVKRVRQPFWRRSRLMAGDARGCRVASGYIEQYYNTLFYFDGPVRVHIIIYYVYRMMGMIISICLPKQLIFKYTYSIPYIFLILESFCTTKASVCLIIEATQTSVFQMTTYFSTVNQFFFF